MVKAYFNIPSLPARDTRFSYGYNSIEDLYYISIENHEDSLSVKKHIINFKYKMDLDSFINYIKGIEE